MGTLGQSPDGVPGSLLPRPTSPDVDWNVAGDNLSLTSDVASSAFDDPSIDLAEETALIHGVAANIKTIGFETSGDNVVSASSASDAEDREGALPILATDALAVGSESGGLGGLDAFPLLDSTSMATAAASSVAGSNVTFTVSVPGSGLVFNNTIAAGFSQALENCIIAAEQTLASNWTNSITLNISFSASNQGNNGDLATNSWNNQNVSYSALKAALVAHDGGSSFAQAAAASLPLTDPNPAGGSDWKLPEAYARMLGLGSLTPSVDDSVTLNTSYNWNYGQDVTNTLMHEISEGAMGRLGGLGDQNAAWSTMDLFRFNASGTRDYTDGRDGQAAYFSYNGGQWLSSSTGLSFNNEYAVGVKTNSGDTADWNQLDVFGVGSPGETNTLSQTDIEVMDVLGWIPTLPPPPTPATPAGTSADMVMQLSSNGNLEIYDLGGNAVRAAFPMGSVGTNWTFAGLGGFNGSDTSDMILRDGNTGNFELYDISSSQITGAVGLGGVGLDWQITGFGDFSGNPGETDMLMRQTSTGAFEDYDIANNRITGAGSLGAVGSDWQVLGVGDFSSNANETDMLMRHTTNGALEYYDISHNQIVSAGPMGAVGTNWQAVGFGDFSGNLNETDMLMRDSNTGGFEYYDIRDNQIIAAGGLGAVGLNWQVAGVGSLSGNPNETDMLMRDSNTGNFEYYDISHNQIVGAGPMGSVATNWHVLGIGVINPAAPA